MKSIVYSNNDWPAKSQKGIVVGVAVHKRRSYLVHLVLNIPLSKVEKPRKSPLRSPNPICPS